MLAVLPLLLLTSAAAAATSVGSVANTLPLENGDAAEYVLDYLQGRLPDNNEQYCVVLVGSARWAHARFELTRARLAIGERLVTAIVESEEYPDAAAALGVRQGLQGTAKAFLLKPGEEKLVSYDGPLDSISILSFLMKEANLQSASADVPELPESLFLAQAGIALVEGGRAKKPTRHLLVGMVDPNDLGSCILLVFLHKLARIFRYENQILVAWVDATSMPATMQRLGVEQLPAVRYFGPALTSRTGDVGDLLASLQAKVDSMTRVDSAGSVSSEDMDACLEVAVGVLNDRAGTRRTASGQLHSLAGRSRLLDTRMASFAWLPREAQVHVVSELRRKLPQLPPEERAVAQSYHDMVSAALRSPDPQEWLEREQRRVKQKLDETDPEEGLYSFYQHRLNLLWVLTSDDKRRPLKEWDFPSEGDIRDEL